VQGTQRTRSRQSAQGVTPRLSTTAPERRPVSGTVINRVRSVPSARRSAQLRLQVAGGAELCRAQVCDPMGYPRRGATPTLWVYSGLAAETYDLWFGDEPFWDQVFFFESITGNGGASLELACGTGRLLVPFLRCGLDVEGTDASREMLDICRRKAAAHGVTPVVHQQLMQELAVARRFRTIYIPAQSFQIVANRREAMQVLVRCREHLENGGELIVTLGQTWNDAGADGQERIVRSVTRDDGSIARVLSSARMFRLERIQELRVRFEIVSNDLITASLTWPTARLRWYEPDEFTSMLRRAGFASVQMRVGYDGPPRPDADLVFQARR
jgi:SAM-dependent methyltransferase